MHLKKYTIITAANFGGQKVKPGGNMKFDYFNALVLQAERVQQMLALPEKGDDLKRESDKWRVLITDRLGEDFLPPLDRRDLLSLIQNLGYISYEVKRLPRLKFFDSAEGVLLKEALQALLEALVEETRKLKAKQCKPTRLRQKAYRLLAIWHSSVVAGCNSLLCDGYCSAADAVLRYADALETTITVG